MLFPQLWETGELAVLLLVPHEYQVFSVILGPLCGGCVAVVWRLSGGCLAVVWRLSGGCLPPEYLPSACDVPATWGPPMCHPRAAPTAAVRPPCASRVPSATPARVQYAEVTNYAGLKKHIENKAVDYNEEPGYRAMDLVFFGDAMDHLCRIHRIIRQPRGNALLVGVGGSGRQSLTRMATYLANYTLFSIEVTKSYRSSGVGTTALLCDHEPPPQPSSRAQSPDPLRQSRTKTHPGPRNTRYTTQPAVGQPPAVAQ